MERWVTALVTICALLDSSMAAAADLQYRVWTTENGLPQGSVRAIAQTPDGYLWLATLDGLVRFDGVRMTVFSKSDVREMTSNRCISLLVDRRGTLWIGTEDGGILHKAGTVFRSYGRSSGLPSEVVGKLAEDAQGRIWASMAGGPAVLDGDRWTRPAEGLAFPPARSIPDGLGVPAVPIERRRPQFSRAWTDGAGGRLWVLDAGYLHRYDHQSWQTFSSPVPALVLFAPATLFEDREGSLWIGGEGGLVQATPSPVRALVPAGSAQEMSVYTLAQDAAGRVWVSTQGKSFLWERGAFVTLDRQSWWSRDWKTSIEPDVDGSILAGGPSGVFRIRPGRGFEQLQETPSAHDFLRDRQGTLWVATAGGLLRASKPAWTRVEGLPSEDVRVLLEARDGGVWVGTYGGLARVGGDGTRAWTAADGLSSDRIRSLHEDDTGALWIGTYDGGLNRFAAGRFVAIRKRDGLYDDGVFAILDGGDGRYYMSSNRGIFSVARRELDAFASGASRQVTYRAWRSVDGMPSSECNGGRQPSGIRAADGTLWFPTQGGIAIIDPRAIPENTLAPPVVVEEVTTDRRAIPHGEPIALAPGERRLEVRYTATTFTRPEGARFRYRLDPLDPDWIEAGNRRFAQYSYVPPGRYVLRILAANSDGVWSPEGVSIPVRVDPYWWQTLWFRAGTAVLVVGLLAAGYRQRVSSLRRRQSEQDTFARRLLDSQEAERKRIASELHDGIGQTLVVIRNRALLGLRSGDAAALARQMTEISSVAGDGIDEVRKVAYGLRPYQIDRLGLTRALEALVEQASASCAVPIGTAIDSVDALIAKDDEINVYRIVQEAVNNMVRHAHASRGDVAVNARGQRLDIRIEDDGRGFDASAPLQHGGGLGLTGIAERARMLGGRLSVRSSPGQGTTVTVQIPVRAGSPTA